jgi:3-oxoacyl-[acyl-carrier-protein] synthase II
VKLGGMHACRVFQFHNREMRDVLCRYAATCDAGHITASDAAGGGGLRAMQLALADAGLCHQHVDHINAHATSTPRGDDAEATAIARLLHLGDGTWSRDVSVTSVKGSIGHLLGAAGAVEALITALAVSLDTCPPTANTQSSDTAVERLLQLQQSRSHSINVALSNSFGFGGTNASLVLAKFQQ